MIIRAASLVVPVQDNYGSVPIHNLLLFSMQKSLLGTIAGTYLQLDELPAVCRADIDLKTVSQKRYAIHNFDMEELYLPLANLKITS